ncbi:MAG TPA: DUF58 domain-containing protein [Actinomycetota bacterium]
MPRPRRRAAALAVGAAALFGVGTSVQAGWLLVLSSILLGAAVAGLLLPLRMVRDVEVERRGPDEAFQGDDVMVELIVTNRGRGMKLGMEVEDPHVARARVLVPPLGPGERVMIGTARRAARRGVQESTAVLIRSAAPFGVAEAGRTVEAPGRTVVYPAVVRLDRSPLLDLVPTSEIAMHTAPRRGTGPEYLGIREYRTGDSMRHVHWPSTARHNHVMVREFEQERTRRLAVVVDTWADAGEEDTPLDACCSVAASVALAALGRAQGVRLVAARDGQVDVLWRADPARLLEWLAGLRPFGRMLLEAVVAELGPRLRGVHSVLLAVPSWRANAGLADAAGWLRSQAGSVAVALVEAHTFQTDPQVAALSAQEVDGVAGELAARGVTVYRVGAGEDLGGCLQQPFASAS